MTSRSRSKPWREPKERRRMFLHLPLHILEAYTNIRDLIIKDYREIHTKNPTNIHIKKTMEKYYNMMRETPDWSTSLLKKLDFILPRDKRERHASIWDEEKAERDAIYQRALIYHKQMIYLPRHILATATNVEQLLLDEAHKRNLKKFNTDYWIKEMHGQLHNIDGWQECMNHLEFKQKNDVVLNEYQKPVVASTSRQTNFTRSASSSRMNAQVEPVPSTSRVDPVPSTSRVDPVPSTSRAEPVPSTSRADPSTRSGMVRSPKNIFSKKSNQTPKRNSVDMNKFQNILNGSEQRRSSQALGPSESDQVKLPRRNCQRIRVDIRQSNGAIEGAVNAESHCSEKEQASVNQSQSTEEPNLSYISDNDILAIDPDQISSIGTSEERLLEQTVEPRNTNLNSDVHVAVVPSEQSTSNGEIDQPTGINLENKTSKICKRTEPTEFQKRVMEMNYETFVNQTNITELATKAFDEQFNGSREINTTKLNAAVREYYEMRTDFKHWHKNLLNFLKIKQVDNETQTDVQDVPLNPMDCNSNEIVGVNTEQTNTPPSLQQTKMAKLSVREIAQSEIFHFKFGEVTSSQDNAVITDDAAHITNSVQSSLAVMDETVFISPASGSMAQSVQQASPAAAPPMSPQVISVAEVRMSECIEQMPQQTEPQTSQNPIGPLTAPEDMDVDHEEEIQELEMNPLPVEQEVEAVPLNSSFLLTKTPEETKHIPSSEAVIMEHESPEPTDNLDDSDVVYVPNEPDEPIVVPDDSDVRFNELEPASSCNVDVQIDSGVPLVMTQTGTDLKEHRNDVSRQELINGLPTIEDSVSESPPTNSPFMNIVNISAVSNRPSEINRPNKNTKVAAAKKRRIQHDDSLSNIQVPKYDYRPLLFLPTSRSTSNQSNQENESSVQIEETQTHLELDHSKSYNIEDSSSTDETNMVNVNSGMLNDSCVERENLLNQDNTLFLNVNTQSINSDAAPSNQLNQVTQANPNLVHAERALSLPKLPGSTQSHIINGDRIEFLHHIDILSVTSESKIVILATGERERQLNINTELRHQCNGNNHIIVNGKALQLIMNLIDKEWEATYGTLLHIGTFKYDPKNPEPRHETILYRSIHHMIKSAPRMSNVYITYGDHDLNTARVFCKSNNSIENLTSAISPFILSRTKSKVNENDTN